MTPPHNIEDTGVKQKLAILIVDVQLGAFDGIKMAPIGGGDQLLDNLSKILTAARMVSLPIIYIQDCGQSGGAFEKGSAHWPFHPAIAPLPTETIIEKVQASAFVETRLANHLTDEGIERLAIAGLQSESCVKATIDDALRMSFDVTVIADGHTTSATKHQHFQNIVDMQNCAFKQRGAQLLTTCQFIESITAT